MRRFDFLLSLEEPKVYLPRAQQNIVGDFVKVEEGESVFRPIADFVEDSLDAGVGSDVPDLHHLVCA